MVTFYLQNSKKILVSWLFLLTLSSFYCCNLSKSLNSKYENVNSIKEISQFLDLQVIFPSDTVQIGKTVRIEVLFKNKTDSTVQFFPIAPLSLFKPFGIGGVICTVNDSFDVTKSVELKPKALYSYSQNVIIDKSFFIPGKNIFTVLYTFNKKKGKNMFYNVLYGHLESEKINLIVNP